MAIPRLDKTPASIPQDDREKEPETRMTDPIRIDIISDIACPWCAIGYYRLQKAVEASDHAVEIHWHPYEINPHLDYEGRNLIDNINYKYGMTKEQVLDMRAQFTQLGAEVGFIFAYTDEMRVQNSLRAHQLIHWAAEFGNDKAHAVKLALLEAFFTHRANIADIPTLAQIAADCGLEKYSATTMLESDERLEQVKAKQQEWQQRGIQGVPAMVFENKYLLTGAQPIDSYSQWLDEVAAKKL